MRFKTSVRNIQTFTKFTASLASLGNIAWVRLDDEGVRFTIIPETGTQVWASLSIDTLFSDYTIQSASPNNTINLELPITPLNRALKSAINATSASLRLTKKDNLPILSLTVTTSTSSHSRNPTTSSRTMSADPFSSTYTEEPLMQARETTITQDIPVRVLAAETVEGIHEPRVREPDVNLQLPALTQLKAISDRFTKLASTGTGSGASFAVRGNAPVPRLELSANAFGQLRLAVQTEALSVKSEWKGLENPELDPSQIEGDMEDHPTAQLRARGPDAWATVRIDGRDWGRVLSVGRLDGRVVACFVDQHALILYVYLPAYDGSPDESVLTYYISSYSS